MKKEVETILVGLALTPHPGVSKKTSSAIEEFNTEAASVTSRLTEAKTALAKGVETAAEADEPYAVGGASEVLATTRTIVAQDALRLWKRRGELASTMAGELAEKIEPAAKAAADAHQKVETVWKGVGFGAEQMIGWPDQAASDRQLRHFVLRHAAVAEAMAEAASCEARHQGAVAQIHASTRGEQAARSFVATMAERQAEAVA